jgi:CRISPR-associated protein Cmr5
MSIQTQEQKRAQSALKWVQVQAEADKKLQEEIKSWASQFPLMIHTNGIGQACAFFKSRQDKVKGANELYKHLDTWLSGQFADLYKDKTELMDVIVSCNQQQYRLLQAESLAYLQWIKELSKAYLEGDEK